MTLRLEPMSAEFGVEVHGLEPNRLDEHAATTVRDAFAAHHLVLLRNVALSEDENTALTEVLGPVSYSSPVMREGGQRKFSYVSNRHEDGKLGHGELWFHSDHTFFEWPLKAISLYALAAPSHGGETLFADAGAAYRRLPENLKQRIHGLRARHVGSYRAFVGDRRPRFDADGKDYSSIHPLVWQHPDSGEPILFVNRLLTYRIEGLSQDASERLLQELFAVIEDPAHVYTHRWAAGDYLVWDNRQLQHARGAFDPGQARALRRVPIAEPASLAG